MSGDKINSEKENSKVMRMLKMNIVFISIL